MVRYFLLPMFVLLASARSAHAEALLTVHEWGTITTRHAADGVPQGGLNHIDAAEVLPKFVHTFEPSQAAGGTDEPFTKAPYVPGRPDVTMRLETPVMYFYPQKGANLPRQFDVSVRFRGGILNEFYPNGEVEVALDNERFASKTQANALPAQWDGHQLDNFVMSTLSWKGVHFADAAAGPQTEQKIWLAPRNVASKTIALPSGEAEKYLFYRGVAHLEALFQTKLSKQKLTILAPEHLHWLKPNSMTVKHIWLVDVHGDGTLAFREQDAVVLSKAEPSKELAVLSLFSKTEYDSANVSRLRDSMKKALISSGLFEDEANAMLETWKESYFVSSGLRVFYVVPDEWPEYFLPVQISQPSELKRVLVGRIDLLP